MSRKQSKRKGSGGTATKSRASQKKITHRVVDVKRHTVGYVIANKKYSVSAVKKMARSGQISGVRIVGNHIQAPPGGRRLSELPMKFDKPSKR